jgi:uncharacterized membrane protein
MSGDMRENADRPYWFDQSRNIALIIWALVGLCAALFFADAFYHKHPHFEIEKLFGFYGVYGFFVSVALVLISKSLRNILMRDQDYYEKSEEKKHTQDMLPPPHD